MPIASAKYYLSGHATYIPLILLHISPLLQHHSFALLQIHLVILLHHFFLLILIHVSLLLLYPCLPRPASLPPFFLPHLLLLLPLSQVKHHAPHCRKASVTSGSVLTSTSVVTSDSPNQVGETGHHGALVS